MNYNLRFSVAGIPFEISTGRSSLARFLETYFSGYSVNCMPIWSINIISASQSDSPVTSDTIIPELNQQSTDLWQIIVNSSEQTVIGHINVTEKSCSINDYNKCGTYLLTSCIRLCIQFFLERSNGFFLHAASGVVNGKGILFTGYSTSGKSTALKNLNPETIIAQDALALRICNNTTHVFAIPFRGERPAQSALDAICFPRKWKGTPELRRDNLATVISEITSNALFCAPSSDLMMNSALSTITDVSMNIPGFDCLFDKTTNLHKVFTEYGILDR
jgi:hypothetical protein